MGPNLTLLRRSPNPADTPPRRAKPNPAGPYTNRRGRRGWKAGISRRRGWEASDALRHTSRATFAIRCTLGAQVHAHLLATVRPDKSMDEHSKESGT